MDPFSFALLLSLFGMSRADTTTTFDELLMHNDTNVCHWWRMVCVRACALHRYFIAAEAACLWCRPWVTPNQFINLSAVTRPRPTSKRTAPLLHFWSLRSEGRNARLWHSIDFNTLSSFHLISVQQFRLTTTSQLTVWDLMQFSYFSIARRKHLTYWFKNMLFRKLVRFRDVERTVTSDNTPTVQVFHHGTS
jgi:hypothetical protein